MIETIIIISIAIWNTTNLKLANVSIEVMNDIKAKYVNLLFPSSTPKYATMIVNAITIISIFSIKFVMSAKLIFTAKHEIVVKTIANKVTTCHLTARLVL